MKQQYQSIAIAVQQGKEGQVVSNPPADYQLTAQDYLIVIATATRPSDVVKLKQLQNTKAER